MERRRLLAVGTVLTWAALALGCGNGDPQSPRTYPVTGKVLLPNRQPMGGGVIQFHSTADPTLTTVGEVGKDGTFQLSSVVGAKKVHGAVAGTHRVTVIPTQGNDQKVRPIVLAQPLEVTPGGDNQFVITLPRAR